MSVITFALSSIMLPGTPEWFLSSYTVKYNIIYMLPVCNSYGLFFLLFAVNMFPMVVPKFY